MGKGKNPSPIGCTSCVKVWVDRCGLTGHKIQWHTNAEYHCKEFSLDKRGSSNTTLHLKDKSLVIEKPDYNAYYDSVDERSERP